MNIVYGFCNNKRQLQSGGFETAVKILHAGTTIAADRPGRAENQSETARLPGINRLTLRKKLGLQK